MNQQTLLVEHTVYFRFQLNTSAIFSQQLLALPATSAYNQIMLKTQLLFNQQCLASQYLGEAPLGNTLYCKQSPTISSMFWL